MGSLRNRFLDYLERGYTPLPLADARSSTRLAVCIADVLVRSILDLTTPEYDRGFTRILLGRSPHRHWGIHRLGKPTARLSQRDQSFDLHHSSTRPTDHVQFTGGESVRALEDFNG